MTLGTLSPPSVTARSRPRVATPMGQEHPCMRPRGGIPTACGLAPTWHTRHRPRSELEALDGDISHAVNDTQLPSNLVGATTTIRLSRSSGYPAASPGIGHPAKRAARLRYASSAKQFACDTANALTFNRDHRVEFHQRVTRNRQRPRPWTSKGELPKCQKHKRSIPQHRVSGSVTGRLPEIHD